MPRGSRDLVARIRRLPWQRFGAGAIAGAGALALTFLLRVIALGVFLPELAVDFALRVIPGSVESFFIQTMGGGAKALALGIAVLVFLALPGLYALPYRWIQGRLRNRWLVLVFYTLSAAGIELLVIVPILGGGLAGSSTLSGAGLASFSQLAGSAIYAALLDYFLVDVAARHPDGFSLSRRRFLITTAAAVTGVALALYGLSVTVARPARLAFASVTEMFAKELTPTEEFYTVTKNVIDPQVDPNAWRLEIDGLVANPLTFAYGDLLARTDAEGFVTLECVSNEIGGHLISTAKWSGLRLATLLADAGADPRADWVAFTCADGYTVGLPVAKAMDPGTLLALRMNEILLPPKHGAPARIVAPGLYGMFHAKWVTRITLVQGEFRGFWQQRGWTNRGTVRTTAIIATPRADSVITGAVTVGGVAFAGDRGISRVEVSLDDGRSWTSATLKGPALSGTTWVLWTYAFDPPAGGAYRIIVRAVDGGGSVQEAAGAPPFPDGASGYDSITLLVSR